MKQLKQRFIPNKENDYRPHILQKSAVVGIAILVLLTFAITNIQSFLWTSSDWLVSAVLPAVIVTETNQARVDDSLVELRRNELLDKAAAEKAEDMAKNSYFAHYSPDGISPWYWFDDVGYSYVHAGENLAVHFTDSEEVVKAWLKSPSHRENILNANYREIGVGTARGKYEGYDTIFVVQLFGTPAASPEELDNALESYTVEKPKPAVVSEEVAAAADKESEQVLAATDASEKAENQSTTETIGTVQHSEGHTLITSNHISTSTDAVAGYVDDEVSNNTKESSAKWLGLSTKPKVVLENIYMLIALFVAICLVLSIVIEIRHQRPVQIAYGVALLLFMFGLLQVHLYLLSGAVVT